MPRQPAPRLHRLPQRLDYTLIPAPLGRSPPPPVNKYSTPVSTAEHIIDSCFLRSMTDLSLPLLTEKSPLPAIIVTPSSPSSTHDYSIAFLAPPKEPGFLERLGARLQWTKASVVANNESSRAPLGLRAQTARTLLILFLILFVMLTHLVTHRMAQTSRRPYLDFSVQDASTNMGPNTASYLLGELSGIGGEEIKDGLDGMNGSVDELDGVDGVDGMKEGGDHDYSVPSSALGSGHGHGHGHGVSGFSTAHRHAHGGWFDLSQYWGEAREEEDEKRDFIVYA
ncbi:hypothetical protein F5878DRAFT_713957 [Lentinula raphanica]|uniref:Uncharacterized protein n=1 Tax=Lentinula raphanica TaxID=153919 RepID=A0AA38NW19_9AGAR|nr:hypothetical protein F5878DRAFT_713957 [Lentinula raphanica]